MYLLYLSSLGFVFIYFLRCIFIKKCSQGKITTLDNNNDYIFLLKNIEYIKHDNTIEIIDYNNNYIKQTNFSLITDNYYKYFIVNYVYNNINYKYYSNNRFLNFPIYSKEEIKNYVYVNKISKATLILNENENENKEEYDILKIILPFVGPNYNFYKDLGIQSTIENILRYSYINNLDMLNKLDFVNINFSIKCYDNFSNEYDMDLGHFIWNPELKL